jgi:hypothetical protein
MSLAGFQNFPNPLVLNGNITIENDLNCKNLYVNGIITSNGIDTNILGSDNTWTGTNDYVSIYSATYTGSASVQDTDLIQKINVDQAVSSYNPLVTDNIWKAPATFTNLFPPVVPTFGPGLASTQLYNFDSLENYKANNQSTILTNENTFTGTNLFLDEMTINSTNPTDLLATLPSQVVTKAYALAKFQENLGTTTFTIDTPGSYPFTNISKNNIKKIDYWLFGASMSGFSGAVVSGTIGNGNGSNGSLLLNIGNTSSPQLQSTSPLNAIGTTSLFVSGQLIGAAGGALNLNGVVGAGAIIDPADYGYKNYGTYGLSCDGQNANNLLSTTTPDFGTTTSAGGAIITCYY